MSTTTGVELSQTECWEVLKTAHVGRVLCTRNAMPLALPVPFVLYRGLIVFSLDPVTAAGVVRYGCDVGAFQVEECGLPAHGGEAVYPYLVPQVLIGRRIGNWS